MADVEHIEARSITLVDSKGEPRIILDAGGDDGYAHINLFSSNNGLEISAQPDGAVLISFFGSPNIGKLTISDKGMLLLDHDGKLGISIGDIFEDGTQSVVVYKDGQSVWRSPSAK